MPETPPVITVDELKERIRVARLPIPDDRLEMVRGFLDAALRPLRAADSRAMRVVEPAVTFDAAEGARHGR